MFNNSNQVGEFGPDDSGAAKSDNSGRQFASGGAPGLEMNISSTTSGISADELQSGSSDRQDFLMIQLSSFEGRANH